MISKATTNILGAFAAGAMSASIFWLVCLTTSSFSSSQMDDEESAQVAESNVETERDDEIKHQLNDDGESKSSKSKRHMNDDRNIKHGNDGYAERMTIGGGQAQCHEHRRRMSGSLVIWDSIKNRIGELLKSKKRIRWPWETLRRGVARDDTDSMLEQVHIHDSGSDASTGLENKEKNSSNIRERQPSTKKTIYEVNGNFFPGANDIVDSSLRGLERNTNQKFNGDASSLEMINLDGKTGLCIGSIFGLDVGGTLAKLAYFEKKTVNKSHNGSLSRSNSEQFMAQREESENSFNKYFCSMNVDNDRDESHITKSSHHAIRIRTQSEKKNMQEKLDEPGYSIQNDNYSRDISSVATIDQTSFMKNRKNIKRSQSMLSLSGSFEHAKALNSFYNFVQRLDEDEMGVKEKSLSFYSSSLGGQFHFIQYETRHMEKAMNLIRMNDLHLNISQIGGTGGGAHKYAKAWEEVLGIKISKKEELDSLVAGMQFVLADVEGECYTFQPEEHISSKAVSHSKIQKLWSRKVRQDFAVKSDSYPYMVVTIGTGVSVLRVDGPGKHERISGSTIGGGTYWGLCRLLTDVEDFQSVLSLAERGDPEKVDM